MKQSVSKNKQNQVSSAEQGEEIGRVEMGNRVELWVLLVLAFDLIPVKFKSQDHFHPYKCYNDPTFHKPKQKLLAVTFLLQEAIQCHSKAN